MVTERDPATGLLKLLTYWVLAQFWTTLDLKEEVWEDDAKNLLPQESLIDEAEATLQPHLILLRRQARPHHRQARPYLRQARPLHSQARQHLRAEHFKSC